MEIFIIIAVIFGSISLGAGIYGAIKSQEGVIGVIANLSIPAFMLITVGALWMPQYPGWSWQEICAMAAVAILGVIMALSNIKHNKILTERAGFSK